MVKDGKIRRLRVLSLATKENKAKPEKVQQVLD